MTERITDEQIEHFGDHMDCCSGVNHIVAAVMSERERADKAERQVATLIDQLKDYGLHARWVEPS